MNCCRGRPVVQGVRGQHRRAVPQPGQAGWSLPRPRPAGGARWPLTPTGYRTADRPARPPPRRETVAGVGVGDLCGQLRRGDLRQPVGVYGAVDDGDQRRVRVGRLRRVRLLGWGDVPPVRVGGKRVVGDVLDHVAALAGGRRAQRRGTPAAPGRGSRAPARRRAAPPCRRRRPAAARSEPPPPQPAPGQAHRPRAAAPAHAPPVRGDRPNLARGPDRRRLHARQHLLSLLSRKPLVVVPASEQLPQVDTSWRLRQQRHSSTDQVVRHRRRGNTRRRWCAVVDHLAQLQQRLSLALGGHLSPVAVLDQPAAAIPVTAGIGDQLPRPGHAGVAGLGAHLNTPPEVIRTMGHSGTPFVPSGPGINGGATPSGAATGPGQSKVLHPPPYTGHLQNPG